MDRAKQGPGSNFEAAATKGVAADDRPSSNGLRLSTFISIARMILCKRICNHIFFFKLRFHFRIAWTSAY
jgi:hypothetical protein